MATEKNEKTASSYIKNINLVTFSNGKSFPLFRGLDFMREGIGSRLYM